MSPAPTTAYNRRIFQMSESRPPAKADDREASAANAATNEGESAAHVCEAARYQLALRQLQNVPKFSAEWFRWKEVEIELRSCWDLKENTIKLAAVDEDDDVYAGEENVGNVLASNSDRRANARCRDGLSSLTGGSSHAQSNSQDSGKVCVDVNLNSNISSNIHTPSSASVSAIESALMGSRQRTEGMAFIGHLRPSSVNVTCDHNLQEKSVTMTNAGIEPAIEMLDNEDDEPPIVPCRMVRHRGKDGKLSKEYASIVTQGNAGEDAPVPFGARFDAFSGIKPTRLIKPEQSATSTFHPAAAAPPPPLRLPAAPTDFETREQGSQYREVGQDSSPVHAVGNLNYGLNSLAPVIHNLPREANNLHFESIPNEDERHEEMILVAEAFLVEENAQVEVPFAAVATIPEPDQIWLLSKKLRTGLLLVFFAAIIITPSIILTRDNRNSNIRPTRETDIKSRSFSPSPEPSFVQPSSQPSFVRATSQPSLSIRYKIGQNVLRRNATFEGNRDSALYWITNNDELQLDAPDIYIYQRYILALLSYDFSNSGRLTDVGWLSGKHECEWTGVECDINRYVSKLDLASAGLTGTIPPEIGGLSYVESITLSSNNLTGTLPPELGDLKSLVYLDLQSNNISGTLPTELGVMQRLSTLDLWMNQLTGSIPSELGNLSHLNFIRIKSNQVRGTLPSKLGNLQALTHLDLSFNRLTGSIPSEVRNLTSLTFFALAANQFSGTVPSWIGESNIQIFFLDFHHNNLTGTLPDLHNLKSLTTLILAENHFSGTVPSWIGDSTLQISYLSLHGNNLTGTLPSELGNLLSLSYLDIDSNELTGTLPSELGNLKALNDLRLSNNQLSGSIPSELRNLRSLTILILAANHFSGTVPSWIGDSALQISYLSLYGNNLTGTLPPELGNLSSLYYLDINSNELTGTLPSELGNLTLLNFFNASHNTLTGTLPPELGNLKSLWYLDIQSNKLTGTIPVEIKNLQGLPYFNFLDNLFV